MNYFALTVSVMDGYTYLGILPCLLAHWYLKYYNGLMNRNHFLECGPLIYKTTLVCSKRVFVRTVYTTEMQL